MSKIKDFLIEFVSEKGKYNAYEMYSGYHFVYVLLCVGLIIYVLHGAKNKNRDEVQKSIRKSTVLLWIMESARIFYHFSTGNGKDLNAWVPLYYCSIPLVCGILSGYGKGKVKRFGDVFLTVGGFIGGVAYLIVPSTSAGAYPGIHFVTVQSFVHHAVMVYVSLLMITTEYIQLKRQDLPYYASAVIGVSIISYIVNAIFGTNFMFVTDGLPGTAVEVLYNLSGPLYPAMVTLIQAIPPFFVVSSLEKNYHGRLRENLKQTVKVNVS